MVPDFAPGCAKLTDFTVVQHSQGLLANQCPHGFVLLEKLGQGTKSYTAVDRGTNVGLLVGCSLLWRGAILSVHSDQLGGKEGLEGCTGRPSSHPQCTLTVQLQYLRRTNLKYEREKPAACKEPICSASSGALAAVPRGSAASEAGEGEHGKECQGLHAGVVCE